MSVDFSNQNTDDLLRYIRYGNALQICNAICELVSRKLVTDEIKKCLETQAHNDTPFWNDYLVSDFAYAALDILGIYPYSGDKEEVQNFIKCKLCFD